MITLNNITKTFDEKTLFKSFSCCFSEGNSYALIGASGCGKTTLLNTIGKLEKINSGSIEINGKSIKKIKKQVYFRDYVGYLFQNYGLIDNANIAQNLELAFVGRKESKKEKHLKMVEALKKVHLSLDLKRKIYSLSGGEAQRVAIAKIILKNPLIVLADEPTASLDEKNTQEVMELILSLQDGHKTIIIATHNPEVWGCVDKVVDIQNLG